MNYFLGKKYFNTLTTVKVSILCWKKDQKKTPGGGGITETYIQGIFIL